MFKWQGQDTILDLSDSRDGAFHPLNSAAWRAQTGYKAPSFLESPAHVLLYSSLTKWTWDEWTAKQILNKVFKVYKNVSYVLSYDHVLV